MAIENKQVELTAGHLQKIFGLSMNDATAWYSALWPAMKKYEITTLIRMSMFFGNISLESNNFKNLKENLNYSAAGLRKTFGKRFPTDEIANAYAKQPEKIANRAYANKNGNGSESSGEGWLYAGKGLIQLTGKENYTNCSRAEIPCTGDNASVLLTKDGACRSACWYWGSRGINRYADANDFDTVVKRINAAKLHMAERVAAYKLSIKVLSGDAALENTDVEDIEVQSDNTNSPTTKNTPDSRSPSINEPIKQANPQYPFNKVYQSTSGHVIEIDDTPGSERVHVYHMSGSYIEFLPDGDLVIKSQKDLWLLANGSVKEVQKSDKAAVSVGQNYEKVGSKVLSNNNMTIESGDLQVNAPSSFSQPIGAASIDVAVLTCSAPVADLKSRDSIHSDVATTLDPMSAMGAAVGGITSAMKMNIPKGAVAAAAPVSSVSPGGGANGNAADEPDPIPVPPPIVDDRNPNGERDGVLEIRSPLAVDGIAEFNAKVNFRATADFSKPVKFLDTTEFVKLSKFKGGVETNALKCTAAESDLKARSATQADVADTLDVTKPMGLAISNLIASIVYSPAKLKFGAIEVDSIKCNADVADIRVQSAVKADTAGSLDASSAAAQTLSSLTDTVNVIKYVAGDMFFGQPNLIEMDGTLKTKGYDFPEFTALPAFYEGMFVLKKPDDTEVFVIALGTRFFEIPMNEIT